MKKLLFNALMSGAAMATAALARKGATSVWSKATDADVPAEPESPRVNWTQALAWAVLAGVAAGLARVAARKGTSAAWEKATGETPPGVAA